MFEKLWQRYWHVPATMTEMVIWVLYGTCIPFLIVQFKLEVTVWMMPIVGLICLMVLVRAIRCIGWLQRNP